MKKVSASVLATVLVVSVLMLLGVLSVIMLWDNAMYSFYRYHYIEQLRANIESGFTLYMSDSSLYASLDEKHCFRLFEDVAASAIRIDRKRWGLYEAVTVSAENGGLSSVRLLGRASGSFYRMTLYIPENGRSISLAGPTHLAGDIYIPRNGVTYPPVRSSHFTGTLLERRRIHPGGADFPALEHESEAVADALFDRHTSGFTGRYAGDYGFAGLPYVIAAPEHLSGFDLSGQVVLYNSGEVYVDRDNRLDNIILVARKVVIAGGFQGALQVFARDTIVTGDHVRLASGSGLFVRGEASAPLIRVGKDNQINGYVIVGKQVRQTGRGRSNYVQPAGSKVRGLVYVDGVAEIQGIITGNLFVRESDYITPEAYYSDMLYNLVLLECDEVVFPLWLKGPYRRKTIKVMNDEL